MTDESDINGAGTQTADRSDASGEAHEQMTALDTLILQLREEADRLLASAAARTTAATLERAAKEAEAIRADAEFIFGHEIPIFDVDTSEGTALAEDGGREVSAPDNADTAPDHRLEGQQVDASPEDEQVDGGEGAMVIDFPTASEPASALSASEETDVESAFGALLEEAAGDASTNDVDVDDASSIGEDLVSDAANVTTMSAD